MHERLRLPRIIATTAFAMSIRAAARRRPCLTVWVFPGFAPGGLPEKRCAASHRCGAFVRHSARPLFVHHADDLSAANVLHHDPLLGPAAPGGTLKAPPRPIPSPPG